MGWVWGYGLKSGGKLRPALTPSPNVRLQNTLCLLRPPLAFGRLTTPHGGREVLTH